MAEEIIDIRDRIEQMRIQIENEATEQVSSGKPLEIHQNHPSSNISLSFINSNPPIFTIASFLALNVAPSENENIFLAISLIVQS